MFYDAYYYYSTGQTLTGIMSQLVSSMTSKYSMDSMKLVIPLHLISRKKTPNDDVTPQRQSQFTPKMKANAAPHLLSFLV